jgi:hypothetical protein
MTDQPLANNHGRVLRMKTLSTLKSGTLMKYALSPRVARRKVKRDRPLAELCLN